MTELVSTRPMGRQAARVGAGLALLAVTLTACGGDADDPATGTPASAQSASAEASPEPSGSKDAVSSEGASGSSTASPEASGGSFVPASSEGPAQNVPVPEMPAAAKKQTQEGLEAALEYWWETEAFLKATGDKTMMDEVSSSGCGLCAGLMNRWTEIYKLGGWAESESANLTVQFVSLDDESRRGTGSLLVSESTSQIYQPDGSRGGSGDGSENRPWVFSASFNTDSNVWTIDGLEPQG